MYPLSKSSDIHYQSFGHYLSFNAHVILKFYNPGGNHNRTNPNNYGPKSTIPKKAKNLGFLDNGYSIWFSGALKKVASILNNGKFH